MEPPKVTRFNEGWLRQPEFLGIQRALDNDNEAYCTMCKKVIKLSNMGIGALKSLVKDCSTHAKKRRDAETPADMRLCSSKASDSPDASNETPPQVPSNTSQASTGTSESSTITWEASSITQQASTVTMSASQQATHTKFQKYFHTDDVSKAETLWVLQTVVNHTSISSSAKQVEILKIMFPDSKIASDMRLGKTKFSYGLVYGLTPHFQSNLTATVRLSGPFVISFNESLNKLFQTQQMDVAIIFWHHLTNQVEVHYFSTAFLGHTRAAGMLKVFGEVLHDLDLRKLLQLAMDGPNVNFAFSRELANYLRSPYGEGSSVFMDMGSCGLHVVHNSFKQAVKSSKWNAIAFLRSCYYLFKDVPARRSDYLRFNETIDEPDQTDGNVNPETQGKHKKKPDFPVKCCAVRWLVNEPAIDRGVKILPNLKTFVDGVKEEKIKITSKSFSTVESGLEDPLLGAKLAFLGFVAKQITPFLRDYQAEAPMAPFLYSDLTAIIRDIMKLFVKDSVLGGASSVCDVNLKDGKNLLDPKKVNCGFAVKAELKKLIVSDAKILQFKTECRQILISVCSYLVQKFPLKHRLCRAITFCSPYLIANHATICTVRLNTALELFLENNWVSSDVFDNVVREFKNLVARPTVIDLFKEYKRSTERFDHYWRNLLKDDETCQHLYDFLKMVLILGHGQGFIERGFSVNKECVVENQLSKSLVAQRQVYDGVRSAGGLGKVEIDKKIILSYRNARDRYGEALKKQKDKEEAGKASAARKRGLQARIAELKAKKAKLVAQNSSKILKLDKEISAVIVNAV